MPPSATDQNRASDVLAGRAHGRTRGARPGQRHRPRCPDWRPWSPATISRPPHLHTEGATAIQTRIDQISDRIYRISTCIPEAAPGGFTYHQFLIDADDPLLYHTGMRALFPAVAAAIETVMPLARLRWIAFARLEADECGAVNDFLAASPHAQVAHGALGCVLSLDDRCLRPPHPMNDGEVLHLGGAAGPPGPGDRHPARAAQLGIAYVLRTADRHPVLR